MIFWWRYVCMYVLLLAFGSTSIVLSCVTLPPLIAVCRSVFDFVCWQEMNVDSILDIKFVLMIIEIQDRFGRTNANLERNNSSNEWIPYRLESSCVRKTKKRLESNLNSVSFKKREYRPTFIWGREVCFTINTFPQLKISLLFAIVEMIGFLYPLTIFFYWSVRKFCLEFRFFKP